GGVSSASSSMSVKSFGRFNTHTLSSLSTASPVTPPSFHLFGSGLGQSGSNLYLGALELWAPTTANSASAPRTAHEINEADALIFVFFPSKTSLQSRRALR